MPRTKLSESDRLYRYQEKFWNQRTFGRIELLPGEADPVQCDDTISFGGKFYVPGWAVTDRRVWSIEKSDWVAPIASGKSVASATDWSYNGGPGHHVRAANLIANYRCDKDIIRWAGLLYLRDQGVEYADDEEIMRAGEDFVEVHHLRAYGYLPQNLTHGDRNNRNLYEMRRADSMMRDCAANLQYVLTDDHQNFLTPMFHDGAAHYDLATGEKTKKPWKLDPDDAWMQGVIMANSPGYAIDYSFAGGTISKTFRLTMKIPGTAAGKPNPQRRTG